MHVLANGEERTLHKFNYLLNKSGWKLCSIAKATYLNVGHQHVVAIPTWVPELSWWKWNGSSTASLSFYSRNCECLLLAICVVIVLHCMLINCKEVFTGFQFKSDYTFTESRKLIITVSLALAGDLYLALTILHNLNHRCKFQEPKTMSITRSRVRLRSYA